MDSAKTSVWALAEPVARELELEVLDVEVHGSGGQRVLRVYLDTGTDERRVSLADCEAVSRRLGDVLDAHGTVDGHYMLEVSSAGVNRPLREPAHFERVVGKRVRVRCVGTSDAVETVRGRLEGLVDGRLRMAEDGGEIAEIELRNVKRANLEFEFEQPTRPRRGRKSR